MVSTHGQDRFGFLHLFKKNFFAEINFQTDGIRSVVLRLCTGGTHFRTSEVEWNPSINVDTRDNNQKNQGTFMCLIIDVY